MRSCTQCGAPVADDEAFCSECGTPVEKRNNDDLTEKDGAKCDRCGAELEEGAVFCSSCGAPVKKTAASRQSFRDLEKTVKKGAKAFSETTYKAAQNVADAAQTVAGAAQDAAKKHYYGVNTADRCRSVILSENEVIVKSYHCASMTRPKCDGYLTVTNKRVLFQGSGDNSRINQETYLDGISGVDSFYGMDIKLKRAIISVIIAVIGVILLVTGLRIRSVLSYYTSSSSGTGTALFGLLLGVAGVLLFLSSLQHCFMMTISTSKKAGVGVSLGSSPSNLLGNSALYTLVSRPTSDTDKMINELGAVIMDLQTMGDLAIEKWKK